MLFDASIYGYPETGVPLYLSFFIFRHIFVCIVRCKSKNSVTYTSYLINLFDIILTGLFKFHNDLDFFCKKEIL